MTGYNLLIRLAGIFFFFYSCSSFLFAQNTSNGLLYFQKAKERIEQNDFQSAIKHYEDAIPFLVKEKNFAKLCEAYIELGYMYQDKEEIDRALDYYFLAKNTIEGKIGKSSHLYGICLINLSTIYYDKRNIAKSLDLDKEAINILEEANYDKGAISGLLNNLALTQEVIGDFSDAISNITKAIDYQQNTSNPNHREIAKSQYNLGIIYSSQKRYDLAVKSFKQSHNLYNALKENINLKQGRFDQALQKIANCYLKLNKYDSASHYLQEAIIIQDEYNSQWKYQTFETKAALLKVTGNLNVAISTANNAIKLATIRYSKIGKHPVIARQYTHLGEIYQKNNQIDSALYYFHEAFLYLANGFEDKNIHSIPKAEQCFTEFKVIRSLKGKAKALYLHYLQSQDIRDLKASLATYEMTHEFIGRLKQDFSTMGSKQQLAGDVLEVYEGAIETALALHEATGDQTYLEKAFFFAEANKAIILLESMNERMAQSASGIPDSLLEKEKQYRVDIAYYERSVNEEHNKKTEPDADKIKKWEDQLYTLRREYQQLIDQFETQYPKYFKLKYDTQLAGLAAVRKNLLNRRTAFLEYFVGLEKVFLFQITKKGFQVFSFEKSEHFQEDMQELLQFARKKQVIASEANRLQELMYQVYQDYVAKGVETLPKNIDRLLIVPDDVLNLVPFEILSAKEQGTQYLIQDYNIGYAYSATLFQKGQTKKQQQAEHLYLGFAPSFSTQIAENRDCSGEVLANLTHSANEIISVQELLGGEVMLGKQAKSDFFLDQAGHYKIIHLATHACMDEENPMQSKVFFADQPIINQELFNLNLSADMAVLSACNTGSGQLVKGDGVMSLSKGFIHAGCPSALVSLWSVDDYSTSEIMINFYKYLKKGQSKDKAIRNAKLEYLAAADKVKRHPFYWAAFIHMGDPVALDFGEQNRKWIWMTVIGVIGLLLLGQRFRKQQDIAA